MTLQMKLDEAREEGIEKGRLMEKREIIISLLNVRGTVPVELLAMIEKEENPDTLQRWIKLAAKVDSLEMFLKEADL